MTPFNLFPSRSLFNSCFCHNTHFSPFSTNSSYCLHYLHSFLSSMKRLSTSSKAGGEEKNGSKLNKEVLIEWEVRPCGLLVQKRGVESSMGANSGGPMIKIKVSHNSFYHDVTVPAHSTFGDLKRILEQKTGLEPKDQRLLFRGKEKDDDECLHIAGLVDMSKVLLMEDPASKERKIEETMKEDKGMVAAYEAIDKVRQEVDKLSEKVVDIETALQKGVQVVDNEFVVLTELLMMQLLKLDSIEADGEAKMQRRTEVHRVQSFVEKLDNLKARNSNPSNNNGSASVVTMKWEIFGSGFGSLTAPVPLQNSTKITQEWEQFD